MLADDVGKILERLAAKGWREVFAPHGLDLRIEGLAQALPGIERTREGFEDFAPDGIRGVEPGAPALSLLYHGLASPGVHPTENNRPTTADRYPTLEELDTIENYIYSLAKPDPARLQDWVVAVFAYEYRTGAKSTHRCHADLVFSRTGIARIGTRAAVWNAPFRCFRSKVADDPAAIAVMPARYGAFLAEWRGAGEDRVTLMGGLREGDDDRKFLYPVHKLFGGTECLESASLTVEFREHHRAEKLYRACQIGKLEVPEDFDTSAPPFLRDSSNTPDLVELRPAGATVLVQSPPAPFVRLAWQLISERDRNEIACFEVPRKREILWNFNRNRRYTSYMIVENRWLAAKEVIAEWLGSSHKIRPRNAPEFVNIRHVVSDDRQSVQHMRDRQPNPKQYLMTIRKGEYLAAFFEDSICDGAVEAVVSGLPNERPCFCAFSVVTAPDHFPLADAIDIDDWVKTKNASDQFVVGGSDPLCRGRLAANLGARRPTDQGRPAFDREDQTMVAIVGRPAIRGARTSHRDEMATSFMTDAASNEFAPGWDVTFSGARGKRCYTTYGLGSPFPEDVKLCAAANAFWPAASPDAARTFQRRDTPTAIPMLDEELGLHPRHPDVAAHHAISAPGWDGEFGPFIESLDSGEKVVNYADILLSDYVYNTDTGPLGTQVFAEIDSAEMIARMDCLRLCRQVLPDFRGKRMTAKKADRGKRMTAKKVDRGKRKGQNPLWLVTAKKVDNWTGRAGHSQVKGKGYLFVFVRPSGKITKRRDPRESNRKLQPIDGPVYTCEVTRKAICWTTGDGEYDFAKA